MKEQKTNLIWKKAIEILLRTYKKEWIIDTLTEAYIHDNKITEYYTKRRYTEKLNQWINEIIKQKNEN